MEYLVISLIYLKLNFNWPSKTYELEILIFRKEDCREETT
jgi:hypothetical protein